MWKKYLALGMAFTLLAVGIPTSAYAKELEGSAYERTNEEALDSGVQQDEGLGAADNQDDGLTAEAADDEGGRRRCREYYYI